MQEEERKKYLEHVDYYTDSFLNENPNLFTLNKERKDRYSRKQW